MARNLHISLGVPWTCRAADNASLTKYNKRSGIVGKSMANFSTGSLILICGRERRRRRFRHLTPQHVGQLSPPFTLCTGWQWFLMAIKVYKLTFKAIFFNCVQLPAQFWIYTFILAHAIFFYHAAPHSYSGESISQKL